MIRTTASAAIKTVALITILAGIAMVTGFRRRFADSYTFQREQRAASYYSVARIRGLYPLPRLCALFAAPRTAFERIWFGFTILVVVVIGRHLPLLGACVAAIAIGLVSVIARLFVSRHLFPSHHDV